MRKLTLTLNKRKDGRWGKKVDGAYRVWRTEEEARGELLAMIAAREGQAAAISATIIAADPLVPINVVFNHFLSNREAAMRAGQIKPGTFLDYKLAIGDFCIELDRMKTDACMAMGRRSPYAAMLPKHFRIVRAAWSKRLRSYALDRHIQAIRTAFKWAVDPARVVPYVPHYGGEFTKTTKADKRVDRATREHASGEHRFTRDEVEKVLAAAKGQMRCFVLLGLNCGMYAADIAALTFKDFRDGGRVIDTYRPKTKIKQVAPLWPETRQAIDECLAVRKVKHRGLVFVTHHGNPWVQDRFTDSEDGVIGGGGVNSIGLMFGLMLKDLGIKRAGVGFGAFRYTHISATSKHPDINARRVVRGHKVEGIEEHYDFHDIARLKSVTDLARAELLPKRSSAKAKALARGADEKTNPPAHVAETS